MFTGIVSGQGIIHKIKNNVDYASITIKAPAGFSKNLKRGASVAVNGVCLTAKKGATDLLEFDVITETLEKTNFKLLSKGNKVNLERSMKADTEIGGHLVSGHIHGVGIIKSINDRGQTKDLRIQPPASLMEYLFYKGYVGLNGCSLTIGKVFKSSFNIHLIPETIKVTNFQKMKKGDLINIEIDQTTINTVETIKKIMLERKV
ncbi:riboflavin synthase subunit alpha [Gammaproteobacteria bacterium]|jgi:riboflavin synthase|nr:riboflavin synthase subunit alpha [Gammaproteobacteria bacterium]MDC3294420.1 riboflavin synthase subunit alpha [bacterium]MDA9344439.1 riboflavin synthase subunit alpha [Gammaproteobacteria bacterium]MDA9970989.1 riboflavin synthase subunit alpha [Gammaproteobacteria bacterium]MDB4843444.1 riboflavin synthase subunit alpha [Gammaproteobacteria bacterium]